MSPSVVVIPFYGTRKITQVKTHAMRMISKQSCRVCFPLGLERWGPFDGSGGQDGFSLIQSENVYQLL